MSRDSTFNACDYVRVIDLCSLSEAAEHIGVSPMTIWGWVEAKLLRSAKIGTATVVDINDVIQVNEMMMKRKTSMAGRTKKTHTPVNG